MATRKYCYEYTEHRQYKCCECGRTMHEPAPHICNGQYRKHKIKFVKYEKDKDLTALERQTTLDQMIYLALNSIIKK